MQGSGARACQSLPSKFHEYQECVFRPCFPPLRRRPTRDGMLRVRGLATRLHVAQPGLIRRFHDVMTAGRNGMPDPPSTLPQPLQLYLRSMHASPMVTGTVSAGCAATAGDGIARIVAWAGRILHILQLRTHFGQLWTHRVAGSARCSLGRCCARCPHTGYPTWKSG